MNGLSKYSSNKKTKDNNMIKSQNLESMMKSNSIQQHEYQMQTNSKPIKLTNLINKKQFQTLIHDEKKNKQKMIGTIQKQKEQINREKQKQQQQQINRLTVNSDIQSDVDKQQDQIRQEISAKKQNDLDLLRKTLNSQSCKDVSIKYAQKVADKDNCIDSYLYGSDYKAEKSRMEKGEQKNRRKDSMSSYNSRKSGGSNIDKIKRKKVLGVYSEFNSMLNQNSISERSDLRYFQKSFKEFRNQKEQQKKQIEIEEKQQIELDGLTTQEIIQELSLMKNEQIKPYYSVENVFRQRIYDDIDIDNFTIGQTIGNGKYSSWYVCQLKGHCKQWAMKVIRKYDIRKYEIDVDKQIKIMRSIENKNVSRLWFCLEDKSNVYLVTDLLEMRLSDYLKQQQSRLSEKQVRNIFKQIVEGVQCLHNNNIGHLDLTSDCVYINKDSQKVMIKGFRLAQNNIGQHKLNIFQSVLKPHHSPELANKQFYNADKQDVWSLGVILYQLLIQKTPFNAKKEEQILVQINIANYKLDDEVSESLKNLFFHIFRVQQEKRYSVADIVKHRWMKIT